VKERTGKSAVHKDLPAAFADKDRARRSREQLTANPPPRRLPAHGGNRGQVLAPPANRG